MRIKQVRLKSFKRFDDLTIDLGDQPAKVVALVGPNGCGKSSVFDAFEQILQDHVGVSTAMEGWFYSKAWWDEKTPVQTYNKRDSIQIIPAGEDHKFGPKSFYVRSAYRFTPRLSISSIQPKGDPLKDTQRPGSSSAIDSRLQQNYERLHGILLTRFQEGDKTGSQVREELIGQVNARLAKILDIKITSLGDVVGGKGQLFFEKGSSKDFPYENLSAGEKEVVDLIIDLQVKKTSFDDTVYCIDEPELHLNTGIQRKLLVELVDLLPDSCQLWVATHSIGFLRALQTDLGGAAQILDFSERDYFSGSQTIRPFRPSRANWRRIFSTALEDLTGLIAPKTIIYCEGRPAPDPQGQEQGLDALVYNEVFEQNHPDALFVSSGGGGEMIKNSALAMKILGKAFADVGLLLLKDRDGFTAEERAHFLAQSTTHRMLGRREIENYLFDPETLRAYCASVGIEFDQARYDSLVSDIPAQDLKLGQTLQSLAQLCSYSGSVSAFKRTLAGYIVPGGSVYSELEAAIF